ncbi:MAG: glycosyltransferase family 2 protein [Nitrospiria bacterium]
MDKISACIISFNEETKIEDCLKSLVGVVDEIIVVDSCSTDQTVKITSRYTDKIFSQPFLGYAQQKNMAIEKASYNWILSLDCDERLSEELTQAIQKLKSNIGRFDAYRMARKTFYVYRWLNHCWYPNIRIRLFNKQKAEWGGGDLHEKIIMQSNKISLIPGDILHYSFDSISAHIQTLDKFTEIGAQEIIKRGKKVTALTPLSHAVWTFVRMYFLRRGFLDGRAGWVASVLSFVHVYTKYNKVLFARKMWKKHRSSD